jgi:hypothetical protein
MTENKILVGINNEVIELTGEQLEAFEADRANIRAEQEIIELAITAKTEARQSALAKLAALGLTEAEIEAL